VDDYDRSRNEDEVDRPDESGRRFTLPGGIPPQTAATALLVVVVGAILWLFFVPESDSPPDLATATPIALSDEDGAVGTPVAIGTAEATNSAAAVTAEKTEDTGGTSSSPAPLLSPAAGTAAAGTAVAGTAVAGAAASSPVTATVSSAALAAGGYVRISGTGPDGIRFRFGPGLDNQTIRIVPEGEVLRVASGPEEADGFTWWRLQDQLGNFGWAAEEFVSPAPAPAMWNPPAASPTFESGTGSDATPASP
jgi:hypothetical protein